MIARVISIKGDDGHEEVSLEYVLSFDKKKITVTRGKDTLGHHDFLENGIHVNGKDYKLSDGEIFLIMLQPFVGRNSTFVWVELDDDDGQPLSVELTEDGYKLHKITRPDAFLFSGKGESNAV